MIISLAESIKLSILFDFKETINDDEVKNKKFQDLMPNGIIINLKICRNDGYFFKAESCLLF